MSPVEEIFTVIVDYARDISAIVTCAVMLIRPLREKILGLESLREGLRCLLRAEIVRIYYRHNDDKKLKEFEYKTIQACYYAYKALKGNSFIDHIYKEMEEWEII